ncbi:MAG: carbamoyl-phosphate synthase large subunit [Pseudomonadota bacterium]
MPKRTDLESILLLGSGPIVIGQACEFDYSGTQALKALREEGYRLILVNSNPATIMTDPRLADATYVEPLTTEILTKIVEKERPDAILPTMGGQTALNLAMALNAHGVLEACKVELIGARVEAIEKAENRESFKTAMARIGVPTPKSRYVRSREEAVAALELVGLPAIIRPSFTLGGSGASVAYNSEEYEGLIRKGLELSPVGEALVEQSILGWKEFELEMMRDRHDNVVVICTIENFEPVGVHTGDSIAVAPAQTLTDVEYQRLRDHSIAIMREIGVDSGGSNIQFAVNPEHGQVFVIEMNPRVSRSSALASKATGYPIARIAAKLAVGYTLDELPNEITRLTKASFEPTIDYVVTKMPRFDFGKFRGADRTLSPQMKAVGEVMAIGRTFRESFQKAIRSLEIDHYGFLSSLPGMSGANPMTDPDFLERLRKPLPETFFYVAEALRRGTTVEAVSEATGIDPWFIHQLKILVDTEEGLKGRDAETLGPDDWRDLKRHGFSDRRLGELLGVDELRVEALRLAAGVSPVYKTVDTCAAEFEAKTNYLYSTYETEDEAPPTSNPKVLILGSGPNRIGQGIEFDYCCVHASFALREQGVESLMVNCNPETVSTDFDISDRLYFEPLTREDVLAVLAREKPDGVILQFGGQTPLKLSKTLHEAGVRILGTSHESIDIAEDRERFRGFLLELDIVQPESLVARSGEEARQAVKTLSFPVMVRPSYVLGGRSMEVVWSEPELQNYLEQAVKASPEHPVLIDRYLENSVEIDVDALSDGENTFVAGIMEHVEQAGVHSGDSSCVLPPFSLTASVLEQIRGQTEKIARALGVRGLFNIQFALQKDRLYVLEVNPRASRTVPFVSKATGIPLVSEAVSVMLGRKRVDPAALEARRLTGFYAVKSPVFPFLKFNRADTLLGPEMKSTGEVMGIDPKWEIAYGKAQLAAGNVLPYRGTVFISVKDADKETMVEIARQMRRNGFRIISTRGTARYLIEREIPAEKVNKVAEGRPHIVDMILDRRIDLVMNTTQKRQSVTDSYSIRRSALEKGVPYFTTVQGARAAALAISEFKGGVVNVRPLQSLSPSTRK